VPYLLLGILTLGTGLAIGLGLSEGPVTYTATSVGASAESQCPTETNKPFDSCISISFGRGPTIPRGSVECVLKGLMEDRPMSTPAFKRDETILLSTCKKRRSDG
jgi:hypothetical protein